MKIEDFIEVLKISDKHLKDENSKLRQLDDGNISASESIELAELYKKYFHKLMNANVNYLDVAKSLDLLLKK